MLPTQSPNCGKRWWQPPDFHYTMKSSYAWPSVPNAGAGAEALASGGGAAAAEGAAAASHLVATGALGAGAGAGGIPPRGPTFGYHHYHAGHPYRYGRGFRRWGGRPSRLVWFAFGAITAGFWYRHHEHQNEDLHRYISNPNSWRHTLSHPTPSEAPAFPAGLTSTVPVSAPTNPEPSSVSQAVAEESKRPGWKSWAQWREERWAKKYDEYRRHQEAMLDNTDTATTTTDGGASGKKSAVIGQKGVEMRTETDEMAKIRDSIERIWEEKKRDASVAQDKAAVQAREYASQKLDKLSAALETLRESLRDDAKNKQDRSQTGDNKWV